MSSTISNLERYRADVKRLSDAGENLLYAMLREIDEEEFEENTRRNNPEADVEDFLKNLPLFRLSYEEWYSEASVLIRQVMPERLDDFRSHYKKPKTRKELTAENYVIEDYMQGLVGRRGGEVVVDDRSAISRFESQLRIVEACSKRFESSLFDIRQLVHADVLDSELAGARELLKNKFVRPAGVVAGIVLERHLQEVVASRDVKVKTRPTLGDYIQALKDAEVLTTPDWRRLQHLNELRVKCTHNKGSEPTAEDVNDLIEGVDRTIKTLF